MKDRHGNEWVFVPAKLLPQMAEAIHYGPNSADDALTFCHPYNRDEPGQLIARPAKREMPE